MRRLLSKILTLTLMMQLFVIPAYAKPEWPSDTGILAEGGVVIDMDSGAMLFGQNSRVGYFPASITKLLTALVVLEHASLEDEVTFSDDAVNNVEVGSGNPLDLAVGDKLSVEDCLYIMLLRSSNQAANALAEHVGGTRDGFVDMMNRKIASLGCTESHFKNPSGLNDPEQLVTPYDMAVIAREAFSDPKLLEIASTKKHMFPATINNPNGASASIEHKMMNPAYETSDLHYDAAIAGKTGYTSLAGNTLVTLAERDGRRVIAVVLKGTQPQYYIDSRNLLEFGLARFHNVKIGENETSYTQGTEPVTLGGTEYAPSDLEIDEAAAITLPNDAVYADAEKTVVTDLPENHPAGAVALLKYTYNERNVGQAYICLKSADVPADTGVTGAVQPSQPETDPQEQPGGDAGNAGKEKTGFPVIPLAILLAVLLLGGGGAAYIIHQRKKEERERALRRQKRLQRLREDGCTEAEFNRMVAERMKKGR